MDCPNCKSDNTEYEETYQTYDSLGLPPFTKERKPSAIYQCQDCGCEFNWIKGEKLQIISEGIEHFDY